MRSGEPIAVRWNNQLPSAHLLPIDRTLHGADMGAPTSGRRAPAQRESSADERRPSGSVVHQRIRQRRCGVRPGVQDLHPNDQDATTLWYHDHAIGITRLNVHTGLAGLYLIRDEQEDALNLPKGKYEIPIFIQDRRFNADGSMFFPVRDWEDADPRVPPIWSPEFFGDTITVNGKVWPFLEVEQRQYRLHCQRPERALLSHDAARGFGTGTLPFTTQIGADQGFLPRPVVVNDILSARPSVST
jgi:spore coat protein A